jgi:hypothetical protein
MIGNESAFVRAGTKHPLRTSILLGLALAILHGFLASIYIDHPPFYDEMYHMLAAESWRTSGELRILDGEYLRAPLFTKLVGLNASICGPSLECARGISVAASILLVFLVTVFSGTAMRPAVGFVAGLLIALNPAVIAASQYIRFYSLHALIFFIFAAMVFILVAHRRRLSLGTSLALGITAAVMFLFANHLQVLSQVGLLAVVLGTATILVPDVFKFLRRQAPWISLLLVMAALAVTILGIYAVDVVDKLQTLRSGPGWAQGLEHRYAYYHHILRKWYPVLWPMVAILSLLSIARWPRPSVYFLVAFAVSFLVLSVAGTKGERFLLYALPFLFIPMAGGIVAGLQLFIGALEQRLRQLSGEHRWQPFLTVVAVAATLGALALGAVHDPIARGAMRMVTDSGYVKLFGGYDRKADWRLATDGIREAVKDYPVVVSSTGVKAAYYLGDFSFELNSSVMLETDTGEEFGLDPRTGRQVVSSLDSILRIVHECGPTLVIVERTHYRHEETLEALDELTSRLTPVVNMWVWKIKPEDVDARGVGIGPLEPGSLNCRPLTLSRPR